MKKGLFYILSGLMLLTGMSGKLAAQRIKATASLDSTHILIGDQVKMFLRLDKPVDLHVEFPKIGDFIDEKIEVLDRSGIDTIHTENEKLETLIQAFTITAFDSGRYFIPNYWFPYEYNGRVDSTPSNRLLLKVETLVIDTTKGPADIKLPYDAPVTLKEVMPWVLGVILIGALLFFILYSIKRKKQNKPVFSIPKKPPEPAHVIALRELDRIRGEKLWQKDKIKQYYSEVTEVLREYIERRFGIPAMEQPSEETLAEFKYRRDLLDEKNYNSLKQMLRLADKVKFAKFIPLPDEHNGVLVNAYFFVNETKQETEKPAEKPEQQDAEEGVEEVALK
jgi:hypothetical protein